MKRKLLLIGLLILVLYGCSEEDNSEADSSEPQQEIVQGDNQEASTEDVSNEEENADVAEEENVTKQEGEADHPYVGMWVTEDGRIRHELLPNGRYDEARGDRESAYQGSYTITGNHIDYVDDTGFTADEEFIDGSSIMRAWCCTGKNNATVYKWSFSGLGSH